MSDPLKRVLITGSQTWNDVTVILHALASVWSPETVLVSGANRRGADAMCEACWTAWGGQVERHEADWEKYGRRAGPIRNAEMVAAGADVCLAFIRNGSAGATHCARIAEKAGIETRRFEQ